MEAFLQKIFIPFGLTIMFLSVFFVSVKPVFATDYCASLETAKTILATEESTLSQTQKSNLAKNILSLNAQCQQQQGAVVNGSSTADCITAAQAVYDAVQSPSQFDSNALAKAKAACSNTKTSGGSSAGGSSGSQTQLTDPLETGSSSGVNGIYIVIGRVVKYLLGTAGSVALLMFVWGGFQYLWSAGDTNKIKKGKDTLINAALGIVILLTAFTIINTLITAITSGA